MPPTKDRVGKRVQQVNIRRGFQNLRGKHRREETVKTLTLTCAGEDRKGTRRLCLNVSLLFLGSKAARPRPGVSAGAVTGPLFYKPLFIQSSNLPESVL